MNFLFDLHTHTLASGHAYGSFTDYIAAARKRGLWGLEYRNIPAPCLARRSLSFLAISKSSLTS